VAHHAHLLVWSRLICKIGACEGSCSCSTCHVIVEQEEMYDKIEEASDDENDMLDLAFGLTETSRLGCQIVKGIGWLTCEAAVHDQEHASQRLFEKELDDLKFGRRIALLTTGVFIENLVGAK